MRGPLNRGPLKIPMKDNKQVQPETDTYEASGRTLAFVATACCDHDEGDGSYAQSPY